MPAPTRAATPVLDATLDNGLRVLLLEDRRSPIVSVQVWYRVGSRDERPGATGLAHFLEHMMFKGTAAHGKGEFSRTVERNGGHDNAFTTQDTTSYFVNIAADRAGGHPPPRGRPHAQYSPRPAEIAAERRVVMEERRMRTEDNPENLLAEEQTAAAFVAHPYGWPVIGWMDDIARIDPGELRAFYDLYYRAEQRRARRGGGHPGGGSARAHPRHLRADPPRAGAPRRHRGGAAPARRAPDHPAQRRRAVAEPGLSWPVPNHRSPDAAALEVLETVLAGGRAARLYRRLVVEGQLALDADADFAFGSVDPNLFWLSARPPRRREPRDPRARAPRRARSAQARARGRGGARARAKNQIEAGFVWGQDSIYARGATLARFERMGSWRLADGFVALIRAVSAADIQRVAREYFREDAKTVGVLVPAPAAAP